MHKILFALLWFMPLVAHAGLSLSPMVIEADTRGGLAQGALKLTNQDKEPIRVRVYAEPFTYTEDGFQFLTRSDNDLSPYLRYAPRELTIPGESARQVRLVARLLRNAKAQEYRAIVFAEDLNVQAMGARGVGVQMRIGATFYVRHGAIAPKLQAVGAGYDKERGPYVVLGNTGTASAPHAGIEWQVLRSGRTVDKGETKNMAVVFGQRRRFPLQLTQSLSRGNYQVRGYIYVEGKDAGTAFNVPLRMP
jgi:hypothetical protein